MTEDGEIIPFCFSNPQVVVDEARKRIHVVYPAGTPDGRWDLFLRSSRARWQELDEPQSERRRQLRHPHEANRYARPKDR